MKAYAGFLEQRVSLTSKPKCPTRCLLLFQNLCKTPQPSAPFGSLRENNTHSEEEQVKKHIKQGQGHEGGIFTAEAPLHASNVQPLDPTTGKPCKVGIKYLEDGTRVRVSRGQGASGSRESIDFKSQDYTDGACLGKDLRR